jgi:hypothetical protein
MASCCLTVGESNRSWGWERVVVENRLNKDEVKISEITEE